MVAKRLVDVVLVGVAAPLWVPVCAACALVIGIADGRPVVFRQARVGRHGRSFRILKLRTMTLERDPTRREPTAVGRFLRARGLDELPQLINVLCGDMSIVGPRPLTRADTARFLAADPGFARRFAVRPGITGLVQITNARGVQYTGALDRYYIGTWSIRGDIAILARTAWMSVVGKQRGAAARGRACPPC